MYQKNVAPLKTALLMTAIVPALWSCRPESAPNEQEALAGPARPVIYQVMTRLFGNTQSANVRYGTIAQNGVGKFDDISSLALAELRKLGVTHMWYTGVLEHATMTDYSDFGIEQDDPDVVKGRAGSPYAIRDYYDVSPDLAVDVRGRREEFRDLIERTHEQGLFVIIDFVPNHVARTYRSDAKPAGVADLGEGDDPTVAFSPDNNFYYLPGRPFEAPGGYVPLPGEEHPLADGRFDENPAKATGNDVFTATPSVHDWFETVKLNYGVDYGDNRRTYFDPIPGTWRKMADILLYWASLGVDGFRCDMAEMVPVEFWDWAIAEVKAEFPGIVFIAEIYNPDSYLAYIRQGRFDYLYDKVQLYDTLRHIVSGRGSADHLPAIFNYFHQAGIDDHMLRFLENHDEQRIASPAFAGNPWKGWPAMVVTAAASRGPVMLYFGQEVGEPGAGNEGFQGEDGRTTIFDYWGVPEHQKWMNGGKFDGGLLSDDQKKLRATYSRLLNLCNELPALREGAFTDLHAHNLGLPAGYRNPLVYSFLRSTESQHALVVVNFSDREEARPQLLLPPDRLQLNKFDHVREVLQGKGARFDLNPDSNLLYVQLAPLEAVVILFEP